MQRFVRCVTGQIEDEIHHLAPREHSSTTGLSAGVPPLRRRRHRLQAPQETTIDDWCCEMPYGNPSKYSWFVLRSILDPTVRTPIIDRRSPRPSYVSTGFPDTSGTAANRVRRFLNGFTA